MNVDARLSPVELVVNSRVFDLKFYCRQAAEEFPLMLAIEHYLAVGEKLGLCPCPLFVPPHVEAQLQALGIQLDGGSPLLTYLSRPGVNIDPHPLFDARLYRGRASVDERATCLEDYAMRHRHGEIPPSPSVLFDTGFYLDAYADVATKRVDPFEHYVQTGWLENRQPHPLFDPHAFAASLRHNAVKTGAGCPLTAYFRDRRTWVASTHVLFDLSHYFAQRRDSGDDSDFAEPPLVDMLSREQPLSSHYLFDVQFYRQQAETLGIVLHEHPLAHYLKARGRNGLDPHPLFCSDFYLKSNADVAKKGHEPLQHFINNGQDEGRSPNPMFSGQFIRSAAPSAAKHKDLLKYYLERGARDLVDPCALFEARCYAAQNPDCLRDGDTPLAHYARTWAQRGMRFPPWGTVHVKSRRPDADAAPFDLIIFSHELTRTGAPIILLRIVQDLVAKRGLRPLVIAMKGGALLEQFCEYAPVVDLSLTRAAGMPDARFLSELLTAFAKDKAPNLILINTACVDVGGSLNDCPIPIVTLVHEMAGTVGERLLSGVYDRSRLVVFPAAAVRDEAHKSYTLEMEKTEVLPQGLVNPAIYDVDAAPARQRVLDELGADPDDFIVFGCGSADLRKGIDTFVQVALTAINEQQPKLGASRLMHFVWVGEGNPQRLSPYWWAIEDVKRAGLDDQVHFLGARADTAAYFKACDAFVMTSRLDPFPCVIHEAMASAKPVIAFDGAGGAGEALQRGGGIVVPYGDAATMAAELGRLARDTDEARRLGEEGAKVVREHYAFDSYVEKLVALIKTRVDVELSTPMRKKSAGAHRNRVIFAAAGWTAGKDEAFIEQLIGGLNDRGFDAELIFTNINSAKLPDRLPRMPYRFAMQSFRKQPGCSQTWESLERLLDAAAPAVFVHGTNQVASAIAPVLGPRIGVLGLLQRDDDVYYEQAARLGRYWQRAVATSSRIFHRALDVAPVLAGKLVHIPYGVTAIGGSATRKPGTALQIICSCPPASHARAMRWLRALLARLDVERSKFEVTLFAKRRDVDMLNAILSAEIAGGLAHVVGGVSPDELSQHLASGHVFLALPYVERNAVNILQAMAAGLAVAAIDNPGADFEAIVDGQNGRLFAVRDLAGCCDWLFELATDHVALGRLRAAAAKTVKTHDIGVVCDRYADLLSEMFAELASGDYVRPPPLFTHPDFGGRSLPPALQVHPDEPNSKKAARQAGD